MPEKNNPSKNFLKPLSRAVDSMQLLQSERACGSRATAESRDGNPAGGVPIVANAPTAEAKGASTSNTAPSNYINDDFPRVLHRGIDSLYLSFHGKLSKQWGMKLAELKLLARSTEIKEKASAQVMIADHCFEVLGRGKGKFAFVLVDNWFHIQISNVNAEQLPVAYIQIASELLTHHPFTEIRERAQFIVNTLAAQVDCVSVSRVDLCVDFCNFFSETDAPQAWVVESWVSRARNIDRYYENQQLTGWVIGRGGILSARLYDKTLESRKSKKVYFYPVWLHHGWDSEETVWRLEFQFKREVLGELGINDLDDLLTGLDSLWQYASQDWLRLTIPNKADSLRSRWETHPLWLFLSGIEWIDKNALVLQRVRKERIPSDEYLFTTGLGAITSFMARENITDIHIGILAFIDSAKTYHEHQGRLTGKYLHQYVNEKRLLKNRKYNTLRNQSDAQKKEVEQQRQEAIKTYRKASDGE